MKKMKRAGGLILAAGLLIVSIGCGQSQKKGEIETKVSESQLTGNSVLSMEDQLKVLCKHSDKWLKKENKKEPYLTYAVTDLDQNGRLEIIASADRMGSGQFSYTDYFQVNKAGDDVEKLWTSYEEGESQVDLVNDLGTAYYDPEKKEYHYITSDFATAGVATGHIKTIEALTLSGRMIRIDSLGYENCERNEDGKEKTAYYKMQSGKEKKIQKLDFSRDLLGDEAYQGCGKLNTHIAWFQFENKLEKVTEENLLYYLRRSAKAFSLADPIVQKEETIQGFAVKVPQYISMAEKKKQERINKLIVKEAEKMLDGVDSETFHLDSFTCTVKLNDSYNLSILVEGSGMGEGAAHPLAWADTINIDCERECVLAQTEIIPKDEQEWVEEDILDHDCEDIRDIGYRAYCKENKDGKLLESASDWDQVEVYQTKEELGVVIPTIHAMGSYQIYEVRKENDSSGVDWDQVDWDAYQYKLPASDYKALQAYMPLLKGEKSFIWNEEKPMGETENATPVEVTMPQYFKKMAKEAELKDITFTLDNIMLCDVTQDGEKELILSFDTLGYFFLILHKEGDQIYGVYRHVRCFQGLTENGIYSGSGGWFYYYQMRFADGLFQETRLGGYERMEKGMFFIGKRKVKEKEFETWKEKTLGKEVPEYEPFAKEL